MSNQRIYLPFTGSDRTLSLGLQPLKVEDWIEMDDQLVPYLQRKTELLETNYIEVFASLPGTQLAQQEVLELLIDHLLRYFPEQYDRASETITVKATNQTWNIADFSQPLDLAGRLVQEDFCLMQPSDRGYSLAAASLCFPLRWRLLEKLGKPMMQIHHPVPNYPEQLGNPVDRLFDRLKVDCPVFRVNWSIVETPELYLGHQSHSNIAPVELSPSNLWIRVERQTLRRLEQSQWILFTIRTYRYPLTILKEQRDLAIRLRSIVQQLSPEMQLYKNLLPIRETLLTFLEAVQN
ncbi:DUF3445 domain-containing protein [Leptolyngbya sp. DQ-M1]|uniref:heme-dependent oxidative N-demethylase family protein n=1 Tax=Leptolyngbya sp. DQ-M1 TaxID=2933920 RepID=UPI00329912C1